MYHLCKTASGSKKNNILYEKQSGFQIGYSKNDAIIQSVDKLLDSSEKEQLTLKVFIIFQRHLIQLIILSY